MIWLPAPLLILVTGGLLSAVCSRRERTSAAVSLVSLCLATAAALPAIFGVLRGGEALTWTHPWSLPGGDLALGLDALSAYFALLVLGLSTLAALGGLRAFGPGSAQSPGLSRLFYHLLAAGMLTVVLARNALLFLFAWEIMSVASFLLVIRDDRRDEVRSAGWIYLVATHAGTACLLAMFLLLGRGSESLALSPASLAPLGPRTAGVIFLLALLGFGTKAGFVPFHIWLPEAHPAAPSHVSALLSGVMIKLGVYGLLRIVLLLDPSPLWWGFALLGIGIVSGLFGVLFALVQADLKRLLAYSSVENVGLVSIGLGLGLIGRSLDLPAVSILGFGGALLHVANHAILKSLLFLSGGAAVHAAHTHRLDDLGGLLRRMPWTGAAFLAGSVGLCGLPPLNGFLSEFLLLLAALTAVLSPGVVATAAGLCAAGAIALIAGLAAACFTQAFGVVFLGEPRSGAASGVREAPWTTRVALMLLLAAGLAVTLAAPALPSLLAGLIAPLSRLSPAQVAPTLDRLARPLLAVAGAAGAFLLLTAVLMLVRRALPRAAGPAHQPTWDCGYAAPTARMQYTASSFAQPIAAIFGFLLRTRRAAPRRMELFPQSAGFERTSPDPWHERLYAPAFTAAARLLERLRPLQGGMIQLYVLYIAVTLLVLLAWKLR